jgi:AcrR family transcriptional regulator
LEGPTKENKYEKIISVAAALIRQKGYNGTSLQEIANKIGINKSSIFHYFRNKEELLLRVLERSVNEVNSDLRKIVSNNELTFGEKLKEAFNNHLTSMIEKHADNVNAYLYELGNLSRKNQRIYLEKRKSYGKDFEKIIAGMKTEGYFGGLNTKIVTFGLLGMLNWAAKWFKKDGPLTAREVSDIFCRMVTKK